MATVEGFIRYACHFKSPCPKKLANFYPIWWGPDSTEEDPTEEDSTAELYLLTTQLPLNFEPKCFSFGLKFFLEA